MAIEYTQQYAIYNSPQITNKTSEFWNQCYIFVCNLMDSLFQNNTSPIVRFLSTTNLKKFISFLLRVYIIQFSLWFLTSVIYHYTTLFYRITLHSVLCNYKVYSSRFYRQETWEKVYPTAHIISNTKKWEILLYN